MCPGRLFYFSAIMICSITGLNTNNLKLVIPAGTKTYQKGGLTHEVSRFVVVPEHANKEVYLRQNLNNGPNTIVTNHEVFNNEESKIYNDNKEPANFNIIYGQYNSQNSKVDENQAYENAIHESTLKGIHYNYTWKVSPQDYLPKQNINWDGEVFNSLNGNGNAKFFTNTQNFGHSNLFNLISNDEFHGKTTDNDFIRTADEFQDVNEKYPEPTVIEKYNIHVNNLAQMGLNTTQMLMFMQNVNNTNKENLKDFWETVSLSTPNKATDLEQLNKLYVINSIFTNLKKEKGKATAAEIDAIIKNMEGNWDSTTVNHILNIDTINAARDNVISKLKLNSPAYSFSKGHEFITQPKLPVTNPHIKTLPKNNYKTVISEFDMASKLPEMSGAYLTNSRLSSTEADLNPDLQSILNDDKSDAILKYQTSVFSNDDISENVVMPYSQLITDLNESNSEVGITKFNNDDEIGVRVSSDYSNNEPYKTILDYENQISEAEDSILQNVPSEHDVNFNLIDKHQSTNPSDTEINSNITELGQNMMPEFNTTSEHPEIRDPHLIVSPLSFTEADLYPDSKSNLNNNKSDETSESQMSNASNDTIPVNLATPDSEIIPDLTELNPRFGISKFNYDDELGSQISSNHVNNKPHETILDDTKTYIDVHDLSTNVNNISQAEDYMNFDNIEYKYGNLIQETNLTLPALEYANPGLNDLSESYSLSVGDHLLYPSALLQSDMNDNFMLNRDQVNVKTVTNYGKFNEGPNDHRSMKIIKSYYPNREHYVYTNFGNTKYNQNNTIQGQLSTRPELHINMKVNNLTEPNLPIPYQPETISPTIMVLNPVETQHIEQRFNLFGTNNIPTEHQFYSSTQEGKDQWINKITYNSHLNTQHPYQHESQTYDYGGHKVQDASDKITKYMLLKNPSNKFNNQISYQGYLNSNTKQAIKSNDIGAYDDNIIHVEKEKPAVIVKPNYEDRYIPHLGGYSDINSQDRPVPFYFKPVITNAKYNYKTNVNMAKAYNPVMKHVIDHDYRQYQIAIEKSLHVQDLKLFFLQIFPSKDSENIENVNKLYNNVLNYIIYLKRNAFSNGYINLVIINIKQYVLTLIRRSLMMSFQMYPYMHYEYRVRFISTQVLRDIIRSNKMTGYMTTMFRINKLY